MSQIREVVIAGKTIKFEFQKYAKLANGSVMVSCGETQVLVTVSAADEEREGQSFFPLTVDYIEKFYATGRIPGGFVKRETKPSDREILTARCIDRPLRPSFPKEYMCETHVVATVMSYDGINSPSHLAAIGASAALMISDVPFNGPIASIRLGMKDGEFVFDPLAEETLELDLTIAAKPDAILMVEAGANFLSEEQMINALTHAHELMKPVFEMQIECQQSFGMPKRQLSSKESDQSLIDRVREVIGARMADASTVKAKNERKASISALKKDVVESFKEGEFEDRLDEVKGIFDDLQYSFMRNLVLEEKRRIDGRSFDEIRPILCELSPLKKTHGSALFQRGETQALATVTLGGGSDDEQRIDSILTPNATKRFMLHYNFPPFSVGEARPLRAPGRREVGHGALAERAISPILPDEKEFDYTTRLVSEVLESNGSSSMATVCGGTLALMDAGVPVKGMVAGIAMGLIKEGDQFAILSDILGDEDHLGDMDFKVCGNEKGITALQMDIKIDGLSSEILQQALEQAKRGRDHILGKMREVCSKPKDLNPNAPRMFKVKVAPDKVRDLIGPGGKMIKKIVSDTGVKVDIADDGVVSLISSDATSAEAAKTMIRMIVANAEVGAYYLGTVKKLMDFGAVIEIKPGTEGMCHISQLSDKRVDKVGDVVGEGEEVLVKIVDIDRSGKIRLSRKDALGKKPTVFKYD